MTYPQSETEKQYTQISGQAKDYEDSRFSESDKDRITSLCKYGMVCIAVCLTITGAVSIYTSNDYAKMLLAFRLAAMGK